MKLLAKTTARRNRARRVKKKLRQMKNPRASMVVYRSNRYIYSQVIEPYTGKVLVSASSREEGIKKVGKKKLEVAALVGDAIGKRALEKGLIKLAFNRNGFLYHGRLAALKEAARKAGVEF